MHDEGHEATNPDATMVMDAVAPASALIVSPASRTMFASSGARSVPLAAMLRTGMTVNGEPPLGVRVTENVTAAFVALAKTARLTIV